MDDLRNAYCVLKTDRFVLHSERHLALFARFHGWIQGVGLVVQFLIVVRQFGSINHHFGVKVVGENQEDGVDGNLILVSEYLIASHRNRTASRIDVDVVHDFGNSRLRFCFVSFVFFLVLDLQRRVLIVVGVRVQDFRVVVRPSSGSCPAKQEQQTGQPQAARPSRPRHGNSFEEPAFSSPHPQHDGSRAQQTRKQ